MKTLVFNGEYWYEDIRPIPRRIRDWLCWPGGWLAHRDLRLRERLRPSNMTPLAFLGHRVCVFNWGFNVRRSSDYLVVVWGGGEPGQVYLSANGTPGRAHKWFAGAPREVREAAAARSVRSTGTSTTHFEGN